MLVLYFVFIVLVCGASAAPSREKRFDVYDPDFPFSMAYGYARPFGAFSGASAYAGPGAFAGSAFNPFFPFRMPVYVPMPMPIAPTDYSSFNTWYKGDNVCVEKKVINDDAELSEWMNAGLSGDFNYNQETCRGNSDTYVCINRIQTNEGSKREVTKYKCCHGFVRPFDGRSGCVEVDLRYLMPTLRNMGATKFVKLVENVGMADDFYDNNYTVFCPPNSVLEEMQNKLEDESDNYVTVKLSQQKVKRKTVLYKLLTSHLSPDFFKTNNFIDGKILTTDNPEYKIRINVYFIPEKIITANCVPIMSGDHYARNGIIHIVEKLLPMPSKTVADIIAGDTQFSILKRMLSLAGLVQTLRNPNGSYTLFAPTDSAFKSYLEGQHEESGGRCTVSVMKHHIVDHVICLSALPPHARSQNMIGELLSLNRDQNNKLYVDDVQVVVRDLMATNGVVHIIDGILSTRQTKPFSQVLEDSGLFEFLSLIETANLKSDFDSLENVTFFVPTDEVLQSIPPRHLEALLKYNNQSLENILRFHIADGQAGLKAQDQMMHSLMGNSTIRFQVHTKFPQMIPQVLVQCSTVLSADNKFCGGSLHVIDKLLLPPKLTIVEFLESIEGFSTLVLLLRTTGMDRRLNSEIDAFTIFAPPDDAFHQMGEDSVLRLLEDVEKATDLIKMHVMLGYVCCSQLNNDMVSGRPQTRTMDGTQLNLMRSVEGVLTVGGAQVVDCDIMTTNGVVHMVDAVISHDASSSLGGGFLDNLFIYI